ncbi:hypothetical protein SLEP1_g7975 [Rubroshorea leprosula]|uniref:Uncharacterized protein n=1 Tax=Rubroshorea leprosula TaxID=152421 RepID=A0AAV5I048_9ROSI|nr:hypothetical protein SLEP1_g7975 [Rubroshorea leprosula]
MEVFQAFHMKGGVGETSYAENSFIQLNIIRMAKPIWVEAITKLINYYSTFPTTLAMADLGCSSGPNTLYVVSELIKVVDKMRQELGCQSPDYQVLLSDLPGNDFNSVFTSLAGFQEKLKKELGSGSGPCFFSGVPGSFYHRLFPSKSLHFVHSSTSLHWLSQSFRSTTINSSPGGQVTLEIAKNRIFEKEKRMRALGVFSQPDTQALVTENRGRSKTREPRGRGGRSRSKSKSGVKCYHCGRLGHMRRNCYLLKGKDKKKVEDSNTTAVASTSGGDVTLLCDCGECYHVENSDAEWIIDSGASYHCVPKREYFSTYKARDFGTIKMGNKSVSHIMGIGDICVQTNVGCTLTLKIVRHVPDMLEDEASPNLWHNRLAHMSEKGLQLLAKQSLIPMAKGEYVNPCDVCLFGKQHQVSFQKNLTRKENKLDLVYSDVCGPLENKSQVFKYFQHYHAMVERETGLKLKSLRTDNGGEYTSKEFRDYCSKHGMRHEKTVPSTPQHNGVAERMNRTIVEKVRCMLKMATLPKPFCGEAVNTAVYLINRSPSVPLNFQIPEKAWTEKDVGYSHLRVFGCKAFMHVPKEHRSKLDDKAIPCIFVGYGDEEFGYKLWDLEKKKTVRSRDVVFHEHEKINDLKKDKATGSSGEGVEDLTPAKTPSRKITDEEEVQAPKDETEEPTIEEDEASIDGGNDEQGEQPLPQEEEPQLRRKIHTNNNVADMMTKVLPREKFEYCKKLAGMDSK